MHNTLRYTLPIAMCIMLGTSMTMAVQQMATTPTTPLPTALVSTSTAAVNSSFDATLEAVRQSTVAAQVAGSVRQVHIKAGDRVSAGQTLLQIDARAAQDAALAAQAQVAAAQAQLGVAQTQLARQQQLYAKGFIAKAALESAQAAHTAAQAQLQAARAQASAAGTQTGYFVVRAPYAGIVSQVFVERGSMAMPGSPLFTVYEPGILRAVAAIPATALAQHRPLTARISLGAQTLTPTRVEVLPTVDPLSLTQTLRAYIPAGAAPNLAPGSFVRLLLDMPADAHTAMSVSGKTLFVPAAALVRRAELVGVYVVNQQGQPLLRQVRLGKIVGERVEVLSGLDAGERVMTQPAGITRLPNTKP